MIFDVENAGRIVGAFDVETDAREPIGVVTQHRAVGRAVEDKRRGFGKFEEARCLLAVMRGIALAVEALQIKPGAVDRVPHFRGQRRAHGAGVGAGIFDTIANR